MPRADWRLQGPALRAVHRLQRAAWPARYTDADPYRRLWVDPASITLHVSRDPVPRVFGRIADVVATSLEAFLAGEALENRIV